jgi:NAD(P)H dehydrogenase (quinone)
MILITGAAGKTGKTILAALAKKSVQVRCLVRNTAQATELSKEFGIEPVIGDLTDPLALENAVKGVSSIYYICPNVSPFEVETGATLLRLAKQFGLTHFVYHSVLHPQIEAMPHHWLKLRMEEQIFASNLPFTILQPCAYMQNILANWKSITDNGIYPVPYSTSARISIVDLEDVADVVARVLTEEKHHGSVYELAGPQPLSQLEVAEILSQKFGRAVKAVEVNRSDWESNARKSGMGDQPLTILLKMFEYYDQYGLVGNSNVLESLIKRPATTFKQFVERNYGLI